MRAHSTVVLSSALCAALAAPGCGGSSGGPNGPSGTTTPTAATLTVRASPIAMESIRWITPLGNLNPPDHSTPTDHIYFYFAAPDAGETAIARRTTFFAPADGTVVTVFGGIGSDSKLFIRATSTIRYYVDHVILDPGIGTGTTLTAGQRIGTTGGAFGIDLGVVNPAVTLPGFVNPSRYGEDTLHTDAPLKFCEEPLRSQVGGRLSGNWFTEQGASALSFVYDTYDPSQVRIAGAGAISTPTVYSIAAADPLPRDVSPATGRVRYTLTRSRTGLPVQGTPVGQMIVQMIDAQRIQAEIVLSLTPVTEFSANARVLIR
jgi:hypothetical protein